MTWDVGDLVPLTTTVKVGGVLTNATMVLSVTHIDTGTITAPAVTNTGTGTYTASVLATLAGDYLYVWTASGAATAVQPGQFSVDALTLRLLSLDDARAHLEITTTVHNEELRQMIDAVTAMVEHECGPVIPRTYAETVASYGTGSLLLSYVPVISLTSVVASQTVYTAPTLGALTFNPEIGEVYYTASGSLPAGLFRVTYKAGRQPIPPAIREAAKIILAHMWQSQRGGSAGPRPGGFGAEDVTPVPGMGFALPNMARDLLAPYTRAPAVA